MQEFLQPAIAIAVFTLMLSVGLDCTAEGYRRSVSRPGLIATTTLFQFVCIPALVLLCVWLLSMKAAIATALILIATCPSGSISNAFTFLARGDTSLSVTLTTISNFIGFIATPLALSVAGAVAGGDISESLKFPTSQLLLQLGVSMLLPLAIGFLIRRKYAEWVAQKQKAIRGLCMFLILLVVTLFILADPSEIASSLKVMVIPVLLMTPLLFMLAWVITKIFRSSTTAQRAILFELPCRNVALASLISLSVLKRMDLAYFAMAFFILESILILGLAGWMSRRQNQ